MQRRVVKVGDKFHKLTVVELCIAMTIAQRTYMDKCLCECGRETILRRDSYMCGGTKSCGKCAPNLHVKHRDEYRVWSGMRVRCTNKKRKSYKFYGGKGVKVCDRWNSFENFLSDMGPKPKGLSIDRIDPNGDYCPENCRWATPKEQSSNRTDTVFLTYQGRTQCREAWAAELNISYSTIRHRLNRGWSVEKAFETPVRQGNYKQEKESK